MCSDVFGAKFSLELLKRGIEVLPILQMDPIVDDLISYQNTLREYGGRDLVSSVSNVAFVHVSNFLSLTSSVLSAHTLARLNVKFSIMLINTHL